ncbi:MAG TPA: hypothetical protein VMG40_02695 [Bryobacteraceae bacterium]|nr:hypothetical protein [Bryobacteraceae bacterium]
MNYFSIDLEAARAEEQIPSMSYRELLENLTRLTELGVLTPENPASMLVVARLADRARFRRSGLTLDELRDALERYRACADPARAVVKAIEQAIANFGRL